MATPPAGPSFSQAHPRVFAAAILAGSLIGWFAIIYAISLAIFAVASLGAR